MSENSATKTIKKHKYKTPYKNKKFVIEKGLRGFLCTFNSETKYCIKEAYNLLNYFADKFYPEPPKVENNPLSNNIQDEIDQELAKLREDSKKTLKERRFQAIEPGAKHVLFIQTTLEDPASFTYELVKNLEQQSTKFLLRLTPVEITCKATKISIVNELVPLLDKYFKIDEAKTFAILINKRNSNDLNKMEIIEEVAKMVTDRNSNHKVNLTSAKLVIMIEIIRSWAYLSIVEDFYNFKKYNLYELTKKLL